MAYCEKCGKSIPDHCQFCDDCWAEATKSNSSASKEGLDISDKNSAFGSNLNLNSTESLKYLSGLSLAIGVIDFLIILGELIIGIGTFLDAKVIGFEKYRTLIITFIVVFITFIIGWLLIAFVDMMRDIRMIRKRMYRDE